MGWGGVGGVGWVGWGGVFLENQKNNLEDQNSAGGGTRDNSLKTQRRRLNLRLFKKCRHTSCKGLGLSLEPFGDESHSAQLGLWQLGTYWNIL